MQDAHCPVAQDALYAQLQIIFGKFILPPSCWGNFVFNRNLIFEEKLFYAVWENCFLNIQIFTNNFGAEDTMSEVIA